MRQNELSELEKKSLNINSLTSKILIRVPSRIQSVAIPEQQFNKALLRNPVIQYVLCANYSYLSILLDIGIHPSANVHIQAYPQTLLRQISASQMVLRSKVKVPQENSITS